MELALSLGVTKNNTTNSNNNNNNNNTVDFCMGLPPSRSTAEIKQPQQQQQPQSDDQTVEKVASSSSSDPTADISPRQLDLLPLSPLPRRCVITQPRRFPWLSDNLSSEPGSSDGPGSRMVEVSRRPAAAEDGEEQSSPNSGTSSFMEFTLYNYNGKRRNSSGENNLQGVIVGGNGNGNGNGNGATTSRGSDDDENGSTRKKLRLSKEQSAFLEESFKEHHTLNPKQKQALAKELNLRPRQVEVWFQNRRARTKLKQTEVDCEYLKRCCETLTEENRRLQKELLDLRALKSSQPFFMHHPATTLTMCPSCERVAPSSTSKSVPSTFDDPNNNSGGNNGVALCLAKPKPNPTATSSDDANANAKDSNSGVTLCLGKPNPNPKSMVPFSNGPSQANQANP